MKRTTVVLLGLAFLPLATASAQQLTADQILERVSGVYRNLTSFRLHQTEGTQGHQDGDFGNYFLPVPLGDSDGRYETDLLESLPGKIRLAITYPQGSILVVSNNETTWAYVSHVNEYLELTASPLPLEMWRPAPVRVSEEIGLYTGLSKLKGRARLRGSESLRIGGKDAECYVVTLPPGGGSRKLWVDKKRFIVARDEWVSSPASGSEGLNPGASVLLDAGVRWSQLQEADFGPVSDKVVEFTPPGAARRVDSFSPSEGPFQRAEQALAYRLIGVGVDHRVEGTKASDFTADSLGGKDLRLDDLRGKIVVLDFGASWCKPCQKDLAAVQKLHDELAAKGVVFLGIDDEDSETVNGFVAKNGYTFQTLLDPDHKVQELYGVRWVPTVVVINRKGRIAARYVGAGGEAGLRKALAAAGLNEASN